MDARTAADIAGSSFGTSNVSTEHLGDSRFTASRIAILRDALERSSGPTLKGRTVVVTQFEIFVVHEKRHLIDVPIYGGSPALNLGAAAMTAAMSKLAEEIASPPR